MWVSIFLQDEHDGIPVIAGYISEYYFQRAKKAAGSGVGYSLYSVQ